MRRAFESRDIASQTKHPLISLHSRSDGKRRAISPPVRLEDRQLDDAEYCVDIGSYARSLLPRLNVAE
jgi:hypothetical protein